jgi:hypothetical protein
MIAATWQLLDRGFALATFCHSTTLKLDPLFKLSVLHILAALSLVPFFSTLEANFKLANWALCSARNQSSFDHTTTIRLWTPFKFLVHINFDILFESQVLAIHLLGTESFNIVGIKV